ncbi:hypothetical protein D3C78_1279930 [compost metagenome]
MKTLFKTVTVVSIATLTAVGTTQVNFSSRFSTNEKTTTPTLDIYIPTEANAMVGNQQAVTVNYIDWDETTNASANTALANMVAFTPSADYSASLVSLNESSTVNAANLLTSYGVASTASVDDLIRYTPEIAEISEQLFLNDLITFEPSDISTESIIEPVSTDDLIKFNPADYNNQSIVEPESSIDHLIKFEPALASDVVEPVNIDDMVKFKTTDCESTVIEEPISSPSNYITELRSDL